MCSFYFTTDISYDIRSKNRKSKLRGPDNTTVYSDTDFKCIHNLLDISTKYRSQPIISDNILLLYNGEIYNSDTECDTDTIIPLYKEYGSSFVEQLDGEYAICLIDSDYIYVYADIFATKPLFYNIDNHIEIGSYPSMFSVSTPTQVLPGSYLSINRRTLDVVIHGYHRFNLNETIDSFEPVLEAFDFAVSKRLSTQRPAFFGLSSGYDSSSLMQSIINSNFHVPGYTVVTEDEDSDIISSREDILYKHGIDTIKCKFPSTSSIVLSRQKLKLLAEDFVMNESENGSLMSDVESSIGHYLLISTARKHNRTVYISGHGADEILCNYTKNFNFKKFPWKHFYGAKQREYLLQLEYISGACGVETRYPMLDRNFVQSFLSLHLDLKTKSYKQIFDHYLTHHQIPFIPNFKTGMGGRFIL